MATAEVGTQIDWTACEFIEQIPAKVSGLSAAKAAGFQVFVTGDLSLPSEQNLPGRLLAVVILSAVECESFSITFPPLSPLSSKPPLDRFHEWNAELSRERNKPTLFRQVILRTTLLPPSASHFRKR